MVAADQNIPIKGSSWLAPIRTIWNWPVYGANGRVITGGMQGGQQRGAGRVGRVDVPAQHHDRDVTGAGQLERGGGGLGAGARHPGVVQEQDAGSGRAAQDLEAVQVEVATLVAEAEGEQAVRPAQVGR